MKKRFLSDLKMYLRQLDETERDEILRFYEERFETGVRYEGKTERDIVDELESPKDIAINVLREYGYTYRDDDGANDKGDSGFNFFGTLWLVIFDFITIFVIFPFVSSVFLGVSSGVLGYAFRQGFVLSFRLLIVFGVIGLWVLFVVWVYDICVRFVIWLLRWHLSVINYPKIAGVMQSLHPFKLSTVLRRYPWISRGKTLLGLVSIIVIFSGMVLSVLSYGSFRVAAFNETLEERTDMYSVGELSDWVIETDMDLGSIRIESTLDSDIRVDIKELESLPIEVTIDEDSRVIRVVSESEHSLRSFRFIWDLFREEPHVTLFIPSTMAIEAINLVSENGSVHIEDVNANSIETQMVNGSITLRLVSAVTVDLNTTNGKVVLRDVVGDDVRVKTTNGNIELLRVEAIDFDLTSSNGNIDLKSIEVMNQAGKTLVAKTTNGTINLVDVYVLDVDLSTTNGNINFRNSDRDFVLSRVAVLTTNGSYDIDVPKE